MPYCTHCGTQLTDEMRFCHQCGHDATAISEPTVAVLEAASRDSQTRPVADTAPADTSDDGTNWIEDVHAHPEAHPAQVSTAVEHSPVVPSDSDQSDERPTLSRVAALPQRGWLQDPTGRHQLRRRNRRKWTVWVRDNGIQTIDPLDPPADTDDASRPWATTRATVLVAVVVALIGGGIGAAIVSNGSHGHAPSREPGVDLPDAGTGSSRSGVYETTVIVNEDSDLPQFQERKIDMAGRSACASHPDIATIRIRVQLFTVDGPDGYTYAEWSC